MNELSQNINPKYLENKYNVKKLIKNIEKDYTRLVNL